MDWFGYALDGAMVLFHNIVEVFDLPNYDPDFSAGVDLIDRCLVGAALVHRDFFRYAVGLLC